ncbi:MAG: indolepyruvate oxidoreductase subunit beta [Brevinematales bacterium]|nr:indolepyruvate oxidoreductase subunit beta [Brevinematales bacterium]
MKQVKSIIVCGVGGQGNVLATDIISYALFLSDFDVKKCEIHGMSQRQGSVVGYVKFGEKVYSPTVAEGEADFLISFEKLETLRYVNMLKDNGVVIIQDIEIPPITVLFGGQKYPENIQEILSQRTKNFKLINTGEVLKNIGNPKVSNTYMLGIFSNLIDISEENWLKAIEKNVKPSYLDINIKAFKLGRELRLDFF